METMEKMEKIDVRDLSIGDYVRVKMCKWEYDDPDTLDAKVLSIEGDSVGVGYDNSGIVMSAFVDDLQPIPITAEVLEKSGFTHDKWSKRIWRYEDEESEVVYYIENGVLEITTNDCKMNITCKSVAELQHALRLTKTDKQITL